MVTASKSPFGERDFANEANKNAADFFYKQHQHHAGVKSSIDHLNNPKKVVNVHPSHKGLKNAKSTSNLATLPTTSSGNMSQRVYTNKLKKTKQTASNRDLIK